MSTSQATEMPAGASAGWSLNILALVAAAMSGALMGAVLTILAFVL